LVIVVVAVVVLLVVELFLIEILLLTQIPEIPINMDNIDFEVTDSVANTLSGPIFKTNKYGGKKSKSGSVDSTASTSSSSSRPRFSWVSLRSVDYGRASMDLTGQRLYTP